MENESPKRGRGRPLVGETRKIVTLPADMAQAFDDFRFEHRYKTEAEALRYLIELGLQQVRKSRPTKSKK